MSGEADPGGSYRRLLVYADEGGSIGAQYAAFGSLWMPWERRGDFIKLVRDQMTAHGVAGELGALRHKGEAGAFFLGLIDELFRRRWIAFRCVLTPSNIDPELKEKVFAALISERVKALPRAQNQRELRVRLTKNARTKVGGLKLEDAFYRRIRADLEDGPLPELTVRAARSTEGIELVDLLLGLVLSDWEKKSIPKDRRGMHERVAENLGWADLAADTAPSEWKFNIWYLERPETLRREQKTQRAVQLRLPMID
ncbi:MAG: hypothetical protein U1E65_04080 [Myxococcota bacterium]